MTGMERDEEKEVKGRDREKVKEWNWRARLGVWNQVKWLLG